MKLYKNKTLLEIALIFLIFLATNFASQVYQPQITYNHGQSFDGVFYYRMAYQFSQGLKASSEAPFVYRIGTPFIVALFFRDNFLFGFKVFNLLANLVSVLLFALWLRLYLDDWWIRVLLVSLYITQWHGPVRFTYYDPTYTDPWLFVFLLIGLIIIQRVQSKPGLVPIVGLGLLTFVGVLFREIVIILPVALAFVNNPLSGIKEMITYPLTWQKVVTWLRRFYLPFLLPFLMGIAGFYVVHQVASQYNDYTFAKTALDWAYNKPILTYIHAYFITYGLWLILPLVAWRRSFQFLWDHQFQLVFLVGLMVIGWIGGSDTERFLYWAMPVVYLLIGLFIQDNKTQLKSPWLIALLAAATVCSQRLFWIVADYPNSFPTPMPVLSILSNRFQYLDLWSFFAERSIGAISLLEYVLLSILLVVWLNLLPKGNNEPR